MKEKKREAKFRVYTEEFRAQAVALARELGSMSKAAAQLGIPKDTLYSWNTKERQGELNSSPSNNSSALAAPTRQQIDDENRRLRRENEQLKKANYILKQAAAFFSQDHLK